MIPPDQCFERSDPIAREIEQRLVVELEFAASQREPEIALDPPAILRAAVEAFLKESEPPRPASFARYRAKSALRMSVPPSEASNGAMAIPTWSTESAHAVDNQRPGNGRDQILG